MTILRAILVTSFLTLISACQVRPPTNNLPSTVQDNKITNALWNNAGKNGQIGFWVYFKAKSCPFNDQTTDDVFVFSPANALEGHSTPNFALTNMSECNLLHDKTLIKCTNGKFSYTYIPSERKYHGTYSVALINGQSLQGVFDAEYCPPSELTSRPQ